MILRNVAKLLVTRAQHLRHEWRPCADKHINEMLSKEERILIKVVRVEKGYSEKEN